MKQYKISQERIEEIKGQVWIRSLIIIVLGFAIELLSKYFNHGSLSIHSVLALVVTLLIGHYWHFKRQNVMLKSFLLTVTDNSLIRELKDTPALEIAFKDINQIIRKNDNSFVIKGRTPQDVIIIPSYIENYASLEKSIYSIGPITNTTYNQVPIMLGLVILGIISGFVFTSKSVTNKVLIATSGFTITFLLILFFIKVQKNKNFDKRTRRSRYLAILFAIFILIVTLSRISK